MSSRAQLGQAEGLQRTAEGRLRRVHRWYLSSIIRDPTSRSLQATQPGAVRAPRTKGELRRAAPYPFPTFPASARVAFEPSTFFQLRSFNFESPHTGVKMFFARFVVFISALALTSVNNALPVKPRATALNVATCTDPSTKFVEHDCNVALLGLGGGIAGAIEFLRVNAASTTAVSGTCRVTATAVNGGTTIDISKGRLEGHGSSNGGFDNLLTACGPSPGSMIIGGGANPSGNIKIAISAP